MGFRRVVDNDVGLSHQAVGCHKCGFGFLFELLEDFYPPANAGLIACDRDARILSAGNGVFEVTGHLERDLIGKHLVEAIGLSGWEGQSPVDTVLEWGVRKLDQPLEIRHRSGIQKRVRVDLFPGYDEDGGLLACVAPRRDVPAEAV